MRCSDGRSNFLPVRHIRLKVSQLKRSFVAAETFYRRLQTRRSYSDSQRHSSDGSMTQLRRIAQPLQSQGKTLVARVRYEIESTFLCFLERVLVMLAEMFSD